MNISIYKAKIAKKGGIEASYVDECGNDVVFKGAAPVHPDLLRRLSNLTPYLADLTEQAEAAAIDWSDPYGEVTAELLGRIAATGLSIADDGVSVKITLQGKRTLLNSKVINITAPTTSVSAEDDDYRFAADLRDAATAFVYECWLYIEQRKWGVQQREIDYDDDPFAGGDPTEDVA